MKIRSLVCITVILFAASLAQDAPTITLTGKGLAQRCSRFRYCGESETCTDKTDILNFGVCTGYIEGVADVNTMEDRACIPSRMTNSQIVRTTLKWMDDNPKALSADAASVVGRALYASFPCQKHP